LGAEKPFDQRFARCLVSAAQAIYQEGFNPALVYVASDELNVLFTHMSPFNRRVEKLDSILAGAVSSAFSLHLLQTFRRAVVLAFDARVVITPSREDILQYLVWRQSDAWRNHNNAYAYWLLRRLGKTPQEASRELRGMKTKEIHDLLFRHGVNLAETPLWQRRGILVYREPYQKRVGDSTVTRWRVSESWELPLFSTEEGRLLVDRILTWAKPKGE